MSTSGFDSSGADGLGTDGLVSAYLDGELDPSASDAFAAQLGSDAELRRELAETDEVRTLVRGLAAPELPAGFVDELIATGRAGDGGTVTHLATERDRRRGRGRVAALAGAVAAAAALLVAVALPGPHHGNPALATDVRIHQARAAAGGDPVTGLAPLTTPVRLGR